MIRQILFSLCLLTLAASPWAQDQVPVTDAGPLLHEAGQLFAEVQDLAVAWEIARQPPLRDQLLVLLSLLPDERFTLQAVELEIDGEPVALHEYSTAEIAALAAGGAHRLLLEQLPAGRHELLARWRGKAPKLKAEEMVREVRWAFRTGEARRVAELELSQGEEQPFPRFTLREWH